MKARFPLYLLWLALAARVLADACLGTLLLRWLAVRGQSADWFWLPVTLALVPAAIAPLAGFLNRWIPRTAILIGTGGGCLVLSFLFMNGLPLAWWGAAVAGSAIFYQTYLTELAAVGRKARFTLPRLHGFFGVGIGLAAALGMTLGSQDTFTPGVYTWTGANALCLLAAVLYGLAGGKRSAPLSGKEDGLFRAWRKVLHDRKLRQTLVVLAGFRFLVGALLGVMSGPEKIPPGMVEEGIWGAGGFAAGAFLASFQANPFRTLGLVAWGSTGLFLGLVIAILGGMDSLGMTFFAAMMGGMIAVPLVAYFQDQLTPVFRAGGMAVWQMIGFSCLALGGVVCYLMVEAGLLGQVGFLCLLIGLPLLGAWLSWRLFLREALEQLIEIGIWPFYKVSVQGPGREEIPRRGPIMVLANHTSWFDPLWLGKVMPRPLVAMMTSQFYDKPALRWMMKNAFQAIRVQASTFRREAPELEEAVARLDRGEGLLIFPEGAMRRREDRPLRHFGQGVWHILHERPGTPVVVCWIEGGWGSYASYWNGPPTVNKRFDFRRPIRIAVGPPQVLDPALLEDQRATRSHLMELCRQTRRYLGLEPLELKQDEEEKGEEKTT